MTTTELLTVIRQELFDTATPYLWSDTLLYSYIDDAQKQFCRLTYGIEDSRSFSISILADGTEWYALDPKILKLRDAVDGTTGAPVELVAVEKMGNHGMKFDGTVGPIRALVTGLDKGYLRAYPKPNVASTVVLRTFRLPEDVASGDDFEIDAHHILNLGMWVKYRAYGVHDSQTYDRTASDLNKAKFEAYCAEAKKEQSRVRRPVSTVAYGGL